jgi:hypothetical protein
MIKRILNILLMSVTCCILTQAQSTDCPVDKVCISREAAITAVTNAEKVTALEAESKVKDKSLVDMLAEMNKLRVEFAHVSGQATELRQSQVADRAVTELLIKTCKKPNKYGLINF